MEHQELRELIPARALDALDPRDAAAVDAHVEGCPECARALDEAREVVGTLAYNVPDAPAPPRLRGRILAAAAPRPAQGAAADRGRTLWRGLAIGFAAVAAVMAIALAVQWNRADDLRAQRDAIRAAATAVSRPGARVVPVRGPTPASLITQRDGSATLVLSHLGNAPAGHTYEAWIIHGTTPAPAGTFDGGTLRVVGLRGDVRGATAVAITVEKGHGGASPAGRPVMKAPL
jgi:anti-sigma factor RsiW